MGTILVRCFVCLILGFLAANVKSAVILQYHHIDNDAPRSTSVTAKEFESHLDWLEENDFSVIPLMQLIDSLKNKQQLPSSRIAVITFDDAYRSICETAWPILKKRGLPFSLFVSTATLTYESSTHCSWSTLKRIHNSGLMTIGNHSHEHAHLLNLPNRNSDSWKKSVIQQILQTELIIDQKLGRHERIFAYPYGEFNEALKKIVNDLGYVGFGQQSGAIGANSDFLALPRFPLSGTYADISLLPDKLLSLPFPATLKPSVENPFEFTSKENPPTLSLTLTEPITGNVRCFLGNGKEIDTVTNGNTITASSLEVLPQGRSRYTCTTESDEKGRFYWISHQWLVE